MKHIESIQPEYAAEELERIFREEGDATATAALTRLLHDWTGCNIPPTADTPESEVEELVPLCLSILRRHWTTPLTALGDGTTPMSLADLLRRLIGDRVQGNESLGIPPANANISTAVAALRERKIGCVPEAPDGVSLPRLLCDSSIADTITELIDDNIGWVLNIGKLSTALATLPSLKRIVINGSGEISSNAINGRANLEEIVMPYITKLRRYNSKPAGIVNCQALRVIEMPSVNEVFADGAPDYPCIHLCPNLEKVVLGTITVRCSNLLWAASSANLIHLEFGQGTSASLNLAGWNPTYKGSLFLSNFRLYIADRLSGNGSGKTLTLSQEVRDAIHSAGIDTIITNKGWTISPVPTQQ